MRPNLIALSLVALAALAAPSLAAPAHHKHRHRAAVVPMTYGAQMTIFLRKCDPSVTGDQITRIVDRCQQIMASRGVSESALSILSHVNSSIPAGQNLGMHPADPFALYVTLRAPSH